MADGAPNGGKVVCMLMVGDATRPEHARLTWPMAAECAAARMDAHELSVGRLALRVRTTVEFSGI